MENSKSEKKYVAIATFEGFGKDLDRVLFNEVFKTFTFEYTSDTARKNAVARMMVKCHKKQIGVKFRLINKIDKTDYSIL